MMSAQIKNHGLIHILASLINTTILSWSKAVELEDQNAIKIDDYGENILPPFFFTFRLARSFTREPKSFLFYFWDIFSNDQSRKPIKVPSSGVLIKIFLLFKNEFSRVKVKREEGTLRVEKS